MTKMESKTETIIFGGGCFWCTEAVFKMIKGVAKTTPGYAGGATANPTYEEVSTGNTGHAEVLMVEYDPKVLSLRKLLDVFFSMHDPTSLNKQGADVGPQYRSIILYNSIEQKEEIESLVKDVQKRFDKPIVTEIKRLGRFYPAEDYHRDYYDKNPTNPYSVSVIRPKVKKIREELKLK